MKLQTPEPEVAGTGAAGTLRIGAVLLIFCLAGLGALVVLGIVPADAFAGVAGKLALLAGLAALAGTAAALVLRIGRR